MFEPFIPKFLKNMTESNNNNKNDNNNNLYKRTTPVMSYFFCVFWCVVFFLCIFVNALLLTAFARFKKLRTSLNKLIIVLTTLNLLGSVQFPFDIHSNFVHK
jgi:hypothetical protein